MTQSAAQPKIIRDRPKRLRAALYGRVSLDPKGNSRSPGQQISAGEEACLDEGWLPSGTYTDGGVGASRLSKKAREDWARLLADISAGRIDVVIVWEWSRADRNLTSGSAFLDLCRKHGVLIHVVVDERTYDVKRRAKDWETLATELVKNAMDVERTSQRSRRDRAQRVELGIVDGKIAYGYRRVYDPNTRVFIRQEADPHTAPIVREIVSRVVAGEPISVITDSLTARGVPTPKGGDSWHRSVVRGVALNPAYISRRLVDGKLWPVDWPALVSDAEHYAAVRLLNDPTRKTTRPGRAVWLCSYIATCRVCGAPLNTATRGKNRDGTRRKMYVCVAAQCVGIAVGELDEIVATTVCLHLSRPAVFKALTRADDAASAAIRDELAALDAELASWRALAGTGVDPDTIATAVRNIGARIEDATVRRDALHSASGAVRVLLGDKQSTYDELRARFDELVVAQRREIVRTLVSVVVGRKRKMREPGVGVVGRDERVVVEMR